MPRAVDWLVFVLIIVAAALIMAMVGHAATSVNYDLAYGRLHRLGDGAYVVGDGLVLSPPKGSTSHLRLGELKGKIITIKAEWGREHGTQ
jgi:hypothetical protein